LATTLKICSFVIPAKAGIQMIKKFPTQWDKALGLPATQDNFLVWIPAFAGMTVVYKIC
jgi:hypothetical protein